MDKLGRHILLIIATTLLLTAMVGLPACGKPKLASTSNTSVWSAMTSATSYDLAGVWGSSATDVFAVGEGGTILHYSG